MPIVDLFDHQCDIYHIIKTEESPGYGLPASAAFSYGDTPDLSGIPCHFGIKYRDTQMKQNAPQNEYSGQVKLALPVGTDVRLNDKIVDCNTGLAYTAQIPRHIRGNHIAVFVKRTEEQAAL